MGYFSRAKAITKSDTINPLPAWEFMNQTGTLGTNLKGSLIYVGGPGDVNVIPAGTEGAQNTVVALTVSDGGSGYTAANNVATTTTGNGSGLTVNTTVVAGAVTAVAIGNSAGTGYKVGDTITISGGAALTPDNFQFNRKDPVHQQQIINYIEPERQDEEFQYLDGQSINQAMDNTQSDIESAEFFMSKKYRGDADTTTTDPIALSLIHI